MNLLAWLIGGYVLAFVTGNYTLMIALAVFWIGAMYLCIAGRFKFIQISDQDDKLRVHWNIDKPNKYGFDIEYKNIKSFTQTTGNACYGAWSESCTDPLILNANGCGPSCSCCCCCDGNKCGNLDLIEFEMDPPFLYNYCGYANGGCCECGFCQSEASKIILSTDDICGLSQLLEEKQVQGIELTVGNTNTIDP